MKSTVSMLLLFAIITAVNAVPLTVEETNNSEGFNNRPTIAILAQLVDQDIHNSYIAASYVKYIESAGGRAVLIPTTYNTSKVTELFSYVNGVLFPGGGTHWFTSAYYKHAKTFYDLAIQANKHGDYFPMWGTCLGFQTLNVLTSDSSEILSKFDGNDVSFYLNFTDEASSSRLFKDMPPQLYKIFQTENITYNHHNYGISPDVYKKDSSLDNFFKIISTNYGLKGKEFISMIEGRDYPFYGAQWHPEKNNFEFTTNEKIPHSMNAIFASQYMANFFVHEARKSQHKFPSSTIEQQYLSYNYNAEYSGKEDNNFAQIYLFPA